MLYGMDYDRTYYFEAIYKGMFRSPYIANEVEGTLYHGEEIGLVLEVPGVLAADRALGRFLYDDGEIKSINIKGVLSDGRKCILLNCVPVEYRNIGNKYRIGTAVIGSDDDNIMNNSIKQCITYSQRARRLLYPIIVSGESVTPPDDYNYNINGVTYHHKLVQVRQIEGDNENYAYSVKTTYIFDNITIYKYLNDVYKHFRNFIMFTTSVGTDIGVIYMTDNNNNKIELLLSDIIVFKFNKKYMEEDALLFINFDSKLLSSMHNNWINTIPKLGYQITTYYSCLGSNSLALNLLAYTTLIEAFDDSKNQKVNMSDDDRKKYDDIVGKLSVKEKKWLHKYVTPVMRKSLSARIKDIVFQLSIIVPDIFDKDIDSKIIKEARNKLIHADGEPVDGNKADLVLLTYKIRVILEYMMLNKLVNDKKLLNKFVNNLASVLHIRDIRKYNETSF